MLALLAHALPALAVNFSVCVLLVLEIDYIYLFMYLLILLVHSTNTGNALYWWCYSGIGTNQVNIQRAIDVIQHHQLWLAHRGGDRRDDGRGLFTPGSIGLSHHGDTHPPKFRTFGVIGLVFPCLCDLSSNTPTSKRVRGFCCEVIETSSAAVFTTHTKELLLVPSIN